MTTWLHVSTPVSRLRNSQELRAAGRSAAELRRAGVAVAELRPFGLEMLKSIGVSARELRTLERLDWCMGLGKRQRERDAASKAMKSCATTTVPENFKSSGDARDY